MVSWKPVRGAAQAVARVRAAGIGVAFLTNTSSMPGRTIAERLSAGGIAVDASEVFTAARAAAGYIESHHPGARCLLVNSGSPGEDLAGITLVEDGANLVLTGGAGGEIGYETLNRAFRLLLGGAPLVVMQRNWYWTTVDGPQLDMGAFVVGLERAANVSGTLVGKPAPQFFEAVLGQLGVEAHEAVMVGDDVESDVVGSQVAGATGVLVRTGKFRPEMLARASQKPNHVIDSVADLPDLLGISGGSGPL